MPSLNHPLRGLVKFPKNSGGNPKVVFKPKNAVRRLSYMIRSEKEGHLPEHPDTDTCTCETSIRTVSSIATELVGSGESRKGVMFGKVQVREYERTVGDNPSIRDMGAPLAIGWSYDTRCLELSVDDFEDQRSMKRDNTKELFVPAEARIDMLLEWGYSVDELTAAVEAAGKARCDREITISKLAARGYIPDRRSI